MDNKAITIIIAIAALLIFTGTLNKTTNTQAVVLDEAYTCNVDTDCPKCFGRQLFSWLNTTNTTTGVPMPCTQESDCAFYQSCVNSRCVDELSYGSCQVNPSTGNKVCQVSEYCLDAGEIEDWLTKEPLAFAKANPTVTLFSVLFIIVGLFFIK